MSFASICVGFLLGLGLCVATQILSSDDDERGCYRSGPSYLQKSFEGRQAISNNESIEDDSNDTSEKFSEKIEICECPQSHGVVKFIAGVPVFNYASPSAADFHESDDALANNKWTSPPRKKKPRLALNVASGAAAAPGEDISLLTASAGVTSGLQDDSLPHWLVMLNSNGDDRELDKFCNPEQAVPNARCVEKGHPSAGGIPFATVEASESDLALMMSADGIKMIDFVEGDSTMEEEPETLYNEVSSWGLDRIDARLGLDGTYAVKENGGAGVHIYVADGGIRTTHEQFADTNNPGRSRAVPGVEALNFNFIRCGPTDVDCAMDRRGHGTHVAGVVGGKDYGVAPGVTLHAVKMLNDEGYGMWSSYVQVADWVITEGERPAVFVASLGGSGRIVSVQKATDALVAAGVTVVVSAGNDAQSSCQRTPAFVPSALTVASTDKDDNMPSWSSRGNCVDLFAPGAAIISASASSDSAPSTKSGGSFAAPHVAGAAALLLENNKSLTPADIASLIRNHATQGAINNIDTDSPNLLLYVGSDDDVLDSTDSPPTPPPTPPTIPPSTPPTIPPPTLPPTLPCEQFCLGDCPCLKDWDERCQLTSCSGCLECEAYADEVLNEVSSDDLD